MLWLFLSHSGCKAKGSGQVFGHLDFKLIVEPTDAPPFTVVLLAPSRQEKAAWTSDISQVPRCFPHLVCVEVCVHSVLLKTSLRQGCCMSLICCVLYERPLVLPVLTKILSLHLSHQGTVFLNNGHRV